MKILVITSNFSPEPTGLAVYSTDLVKTLSKENYEVTVLTGLPHYPWWKVSAENLFTDKTVFDQNLVSIIRVSHYVPNLMNVFIRIRYELSLLRHFRRALKELSEMDYDVIISLIPTVASGIVGRLVSRKFKIPFGLIVHDLSGAGAKQSGIVGGALISQIASLIERSLFHRADSIVVVSPAMIRILVGFGVPITKIKQIFNYSANLISVGSRNSTRSRFSWPSEDFVVLHTGNMGKKQDLENVVRAADILATYQNIKIYLVGHGNQESYLKSLCAGKKNIAVLPAVLDADYSGLLASADLLLVNERITQKEMSLPSKLTSYLFSRRPVIAAVPRNGATWDFLEGIAELVEAGNPTLLAQAIKDLSQNQDKRIELADKGLEFARINLGADIGRKKYLNWVDALLESKLG